jgi:hypothetical protein
MSRSPAADRPTLHKPSKLEALGLSLAAALLACYSVGLVLDRWESHDLAGTVAFRAYVITVASILGWRAGRAWHRRLKYDDPN